MLLTKHEHFGLRDVFRLGVLVLTILQSYPSNGKQYDQGENTKSSMKQLLLRAPKARI